MNLNFTNKTVIITGSTRGIGAAMVSAFSGAEANVIITGTKEPGAVNLDLIKSNRSIQYHQLDFSSDESVKKFIHTVKISFK